MLNAEEEQIKNEKIRQAEARLNEMKTVHERNKQEIESLDEELEKAEEMTLPQETEDNEQADQTDANQAAE